MARKRPRAAVRKVERSEAHTIADGVYHVARELLESTPRSELPLPVFAYAPVAYAMEMIAAVICERQGLPAERVHEVGLYLATGVLEVAAAAAAGFDVEHFEAWAAAARHQEVKRG